MFLTATAPARAFAAEQGPCFVYTEATAVQVVEAAAVIVVGTVSESVPEHSATIAPDYYLKGATLPERLTLAFDPQLPCEPASLDTGQRLLVILGARDGVLVWPGTAQVMDLRGGAAYATDGLELGSETAVVDRIRAISGQYSVPAASPAEGAGIDWLGTVLPVTAATLVVFAIALVLMREWHRIDPT